MIRILLVCILGASATSWIDFRVRMLFTVMDRLVEETADRYADYDKFREDDSGIKSFVYDFSASSFKYKYRDIKQFLIETMDQLDDDGNDLRIKKEMIERAAPLVDSLVDSAFSATIFMKADTPELEWLLGMFYNLLEGWYRWLIELQLTLAHVIALEDDKLSWLQIERAALSSSLGHLTRKLQDSNERMLGLDGEDRVHLESVTDIITRLGANQVTLDAYLPQARKEILDKSDTADLIATCREIITVVELTIDNLEYASSFL
jgi:hypothetical protein